MLKAVVGSSDDTTAIVSLNTGWGLFAGRPLKVSRRNGVVYLEGAISTASPLTIRGGPVFVLPHAKYGCVGRNVTQFSGAAVLSVLPTSIEVDISEYVPRYYDPDFDVWVPEQLSSVQIIISELPGHATDGFIAYFGICWQANI